MLLTLKTLSLTGFRSWLQESTVDLSLPGLAYVTGRNELEPSLGANGAGKSTLFEALFWVLFGKTSRNLRAGDISTWENDESPIVELTFTLDNEKHALKRTWNPVSLMLNDSPLTQEELERMLGYSPDTFLHSVFHAQFGEFFADLAPSSQLELYTEVLRLDVWERASEAAAKYARQAESNAHEHEIELARASTRASERRAQLEALEKLEHTWHREHMTHLREFTKKVRQAEAQEQKAKRTLNAFTLSSSSSTVKIKTLQNKYDYWLDKETQALVSARERSKAWQRLEDTLGVATCPQCGQSVSVKHLAKEMERLQAEVVLFKQAYATAQTQRKDFGLAAAKEQDKRDLDQNKYGRLEAEAQEAQHAVRVAKNRLVEEAAKECPHDVENMQQQVEHAQQQVENRKRGLQEVQEALAAYNYWNQAFREIRLALIKTSLAQFEVTTNSALHALGLEDWSVEYAVEAETKTGKLKRGFSIAVRSPYNDGAVPFAAWSGGESQRLRLAITLGLSDLIQDFSGVSCNVEIFDEPTTHLSDSGINSLLQVLEERAQSRSVWLADHHALEYGGFERVVTVCKTEEGSQIE